MKSAEADHKQLFVDCLIKNDNGQLFAQKKSAERRKFPGCWDLPGGGVEKGESITAAARRELREELGFELDQVTAVAGVFEYTLPSEMVSAQGNPHHQIIKLLVTVHDHSNPILEVGKAVDYGWFDKDTIDILLENREIGSDGYDYVYQAVKSAL